MYILQLLIIILLRDVFNCGACMIINMGGEMLDWGA